jgi:hypothetical protein
VVTAVYRRNGRVWRWEGDGGVLAFLFGDKNVQAALAGIAELLVGGRRRIHPGRPAGQARKPRAACDPGVIEGPSAQ